MKPYWTGRGSSTPLTNAEQIDLGLGTNKRWYRFKNEPHNRLTLWYDGIGYRVPDDLIHDFGSIPPIIQGIPFMSRWFSKDSYPNSVELHDAAYEDGGVDGPHCLWISKDNGETWSVEAINRHVGDLLLKQGIIAEDGYKWVAQTYYWFVRRFGGFNWKDGCVN